MNNVLENVIVRQEHPVVHEQHQVRRVSTLDTLALHVGVALIKWGRRPLVADSRERRANRIEQHIARIERERAAERVLRLSVPLR